MTGSAGPSSTVSSRVASAVIGRLVHDLHRHQRRRGARAGEAANGLVWDPEDVADRLPALGPVVGTPWPLPRFPVSDSACTACRTLHRNGVRALRGRRSAPRPGTERDTGSHRPMSRPLPRRGGLAPRKPCAFESGREPTAKPPTSNEAGSCRDVQVTVWVAANGRHASSGSVDPADRRSRRLFWSLPQALVG